MRTDYLVNDTAALRTRAVRAGRHVLAAQAVAMALSLLSMAVLGRLLEPAAFGLVAIVATVTGLVSTFADAGLSMASVQRQVVSQQQVSNLFWANVLLGVVVAGIVAAISPLVGMFFGESQLTAICAASSLAFAFAGLGVQHDALLRRTLRFGRLSAAAIFASAGGVAVAILLAWGGFGFWALVWQQIVTAALRSAALWILCDWRPSRPVRGVGTMGLFRFGGAVTVSGMLGYFLRNADNILIGKVWGAEALGVYSRAYALLMQPLVQLSGPISAVAMPALSRVQDEPARLREAYRRAVLLLCAVVLPAAAMMLACARPLVTVLLGSQWTECVPIFRALGGAVILGTMTSAPISWAYASLGRARAQLRWSLLSVPFCVACYAVAVPWGIWTVALSVSIAFAVIAGPGIVAALGGTPIGVTTYLGAVTLPLACSAAGFVAATVAIGMLGGGEPPALALVVGGFAFVAGYVISWVSTRAGRARIRELWQFVRPERPA